MMDSSKPAENIPNQKSLCGLCRGITIESLSAPGGYRHAPSPETLDRNKTSCDLCKAFSSKQPTNSTIIGPYYLKIVKSKANTESKDSAILRLFQSYLNVDHALSEFHLFSNSGDSAVQYGVRERRCLSRTSSQQSFEIALVWLQQCLSEHNCSTGLFQIPWTGEWPARLIDVCCWDPPCEDVRLVTFTGPCPSYVTLSYCWGPPSDDRYDTKSTTLELRMLKILYCDLPKTFQDAVTITRRLGIRYIWIDALCIIQDSKVDWNVESAKMGAIYGGSLLTIAADRSEHSEGGCFNSSSKGQLDEFPEMAVHIKNRLSSGLDSNLYVWDTSSHMFEDIEIRKKYVGIERGPLSRRAWTLQERWLSNRILHYTDHQLFWECRQSMLAEDNLPMLQDDFTRHALAGYSAYSNLYSPSENLLFFWYNSLISRNYSTRRLTLSTDKLPAISAISRLISRHLLRHGKQSTYLAGVWMENLGWGLSWYRLGPASRPPEYRCPSFSWAALDCEVEWPAYFSSFAEFEVVDINMEAQDQDSFGRLSGGWIKLSGALKQAKIIHSLYNVDHSNMDMKSITGTLVGCAMTDCDQSARAIHCLKIGELRNPTRGGRVLLLEPRAERSGEFVRIGSGAIFDSSWMSSGWNKTTITIY